jgi:hypothetical protein
VESFCIQMPGNRWSVSGDFAIANRFSERRHDPAAVIQPRHISSTVTALNRPVNASEFFIRAGGHGVAVFAGHSQVGLQRRVTDAIKRSWTQYGLRL